MTENEDDRKKFQNLLCKITNLNIKGNFHPAFINNNYFYQFLFAIYQGNQQFTTVCINTRLARKLYS